MCTNTNKLFTTEIKLLGYSCNDVSIYMTLMIFYMLLIAGKHKLNINAGQIHREALLVKAKKRNLCTVAGYNIAHTIIHIIYVLFITTNNVGFLIVSVLAHFVGVVLVYKSQRPDHEHPIRALAKSLRNIDAADKETKNDLIYIIEQIKKNKIKW